MQEQLQETHQFHVKAHVAEVREFEAHANRRVEAHAAEIVECKKIETRLKDEIARAKQNAELKAKELVAERDAVWRQEKDALSQGERTYQGRLR